MTNKRTWLLLLIFGGGLMAVFSQCLSLKNDPLSTGLCLVRVVVLHFLTTAFRDEIFQENNYRTNNLNSIFLLFDCVEADFKSPKTEQASVSADLFSLAPEAGLEPATL